MKSSHFTPQSVFRVLSALILVASVCATVSLAAIPAARAANNRLQFDGKAIYLNGINTPWNKFGNDFGSQYDPVYFETMFTQMQQYGVNTTRVWVHTDGRSSPLFAPDGSVSGLPPTFLNDLGDYLDRAQAHNVSVVVALWAFDMDGRYNNNISHADLISDTAKTQSYIDNALIPVIERFKHHPAVLAWEVINEPEWLLVDEAGNSRTPVTREQMSRFIGLVSAEINTRTSQYVTAGAAMWKYHCEKLGNQPPDNGLCHGNMYSDTALRTASGRPEAGLDFYQVHYYNWQEPYWPMMKPGYGPDYYLNDLKPVIIGELPINTTVGKRQSMDAAYANGYAGHLMWSYWYDPCCGGGWDDIKSELRAFRDDHASKVDLNLNGRNETPAPPPSATVTLTAAPTPVCTDTGAVTLYDDALGSGWSDGSWDTTTNYANSAPVRSGSASLAVTHNAGYAGLQWLPAVPPSLGYGDRLVFWLNGGASGGQKLWLKISGNEAQVYNLPDLQANTWTRIEVPVTFFRNPATLTQLFLQNATSAPQATFYVDDASLIQTSCTGVPTATSLPPTATPGTAPSRLLYGFETGLEGWADVNGSTTSVAQRRQNATEGSHALEITSPGSWYSVKPGNLDFTGYGRLAFDVFWSGAGANSVAVAIQVGDGWAWTQSTLNYPLAPGASTVTVDLTTDFNGALPELNKVKAINIYFNAGTFYLDNVRLANAGSAATATATSTAAASATPSPTPSATPTASATATLTPSATATPAPAPVRSVRPVVSCVQANADGTLTAFFGYTSSNANPVRIPVGARNGFAPRPYDQGQPTVFAPGTHSAVFRVTVLRYAAWTLDGRTVTATRNSTPCLAYP